MIGTKYTTTPRAVDTSIDGQGDFFMEYRKKVELKQENEVIINLNCDIFNKKYNENNTIIILKHLFTYYSSKSAHTFIDEGNDYNYIPQDDAVEILISSNLAQHILEIIWNESKENNEKNNTSSNTLDDEDINAGLNQHEFITATQLISLAQSSLPYNKHYLYTQHSMRMLIIYFFLFFYNRFIHTMII